MVHNEGKGWIRNGIITIGIGLLSWEAGAATFTVNPQNLRQQLVRNNLAVQVALNQVIRAKDQVFAARMNLLPSINLGAVLASTTNPSFAVNSITLLLPFLLPSNWLDFGRSKLVLQAEMLSYRLVQLNEYASAYAIYMTIVEDVRLREVLNRQYDDFRDIEGTIANKYEWGLATQADLNMARAKTNLAHYQVSQMDGLLKTELAALRTALTLPIETEIVVENVGVPPSNQEGKRWEDILAEAQRLSPERAQVDFLIQASKKDKWSKLFGFVSGASLSTKLDGGSGSVPPSFSSVVQNISGNLGFSTIANLRLSRDDIHAYELRREEIRLEQAKVIETTLGLMAENKKQVDLASAAERDILSAYAVELEKYRAGLTDLLHVYDARGQVTQASTSLIKAQIDLNTQRISLHRLLLSDQFAEIQGCQPDPDQKKLPKHPSLDQVCRG